MPKLSLTLLIRMIGFKLCLIVRISRPSDSNVFTTEHSEN